MLILKNHLKLQKNSKIWIHFLLELPRSDIKKLVNLDTYSILDLVEVDYFEFLVPKPFL